MTGSWIRATSSEPETRSPAENRLMQLRPGCFISRDQHTESPPVIQWARFLWHQTLMGFDYWEVHPARGAISRVHVEWRLSLYNPANLPEGVDVTRLQKARRLGCQTRAFTARPRVLGGAPRGSSSRG